MGTTRDPAQYTNTAQEQGHGGEHGAKVVDEPHHELH